MDGSLHHWRRRVIPSCRGQARKAVGQLRDRGLIAELEDGAWLEITFAPEGAQDPEALVSEWLNEVWPAWETCLEDPDHVD
ncbi:MAG: hypothetical protein ACRDLL_01285 [Solirubrobacterales bacterium]